MSRTSTKAERVLEELVDALGRAEIDVRTERLGVGTSGGLCWIEGKPVIFVEKTLPAQQRLEFVVGELGALDLGDVFLPPTVRELLGAAEPASSEPAFSERDADETAEEAPTA